MFKKMCALLLVLVFALGSAAHAERCVTDMYGREIRLEQPARRIVVLTAADCEILCALGCGDLLVGRGAYCDEPESILEVPVVQSGFDTNLEEILALSPDVVLMGDMNQSRDQVLMLESLGVPAAVSNSDSVEDTYTAIRMIGAIAGREAGAEALIAQMQSTFASIREQSVQSGKTVYFEVSPLAYGLWAAGSGTFMDELAQMCGLTNAFADLEGWGAISEEQVLARDPDYIVTIAMYFGEGLTPVEEIISRPGWENLKAVQNGCVFNADSNAISRPGPRLMDAALELHAFVQESVR